MGIIKRQYFNTLVGAVALLLLLFFSDVGYSATDLFANGSNPVMSMSNVTTKEVSALQSLCTKVNEDLVAESKDTGVTSDSTMIACQRDENSEVNTETQIYNVAFNATYYNNLEQLEKQKVMSIILSDIDNSNLSQISKTKVYNFISNSDTATSNLVRQLSDDVKADYADAYNSFKPFTGVIGWILGILVFIIFVLLGLTITVDIAYIVIPMFQNFLSSENDGAKPRYVSGEAWNAVKAAEQSVGHSYREPLGIYFKSKTKQFIAIGLCLLYLVSGHIYNLIAYVIDAFQGIIG